MDCKGFRGNIGSICRSACVGGWLTVVSAVVCVIGLSVPYILMRYSLNFGDELYQILNTMDYTVAPQAPLTYWLSALWGQLNGFAIISFRTLSVTVANLTVVIGGVYFFYKIRNLTAVLLVTGVSALMLALIQQKCYLFGWDVLHCRQFNPVA